MSSAEKSVPQVDFSVRGPLPGMGAAVERILRALPAWFGIEAALQAYVAAAEELDTFVLLVDRPACGGDLREVRPDQVIGFVTLRETSEDALEIHVMGVLPAWHRRGGGRALVERAAKYAGAEGYSLLHVKTLAPSNPDPGYAATRAFYEAVGFRPLEVLPQVWGPKNPCLLLVRPLWAANV
jgi:GNAT superfamily N-acetyltransferase